MSHVPVCTSCLFLGSSKPQSWAGCAKASLFISRRSAFHPHPSSALPPRCVFIGQSRMNHRMLTYSRGVMWLVEMIIHREWTAVQDDSIIFFFFHLVWTWCIVVPLFRPSACSCPDTVLYAHGWGVRGVRSRMEWRTCFSLYSENESMRQREKEREKEKDSPSIHVLSSNPSSPQPGAAAKLIGEHEEREGAGSTDQGSVAISLCIYWSVIRSSEWVQPLLSPTPNPVPKTHTPHEPCIRAAGPVDRGGPPWPSTVRGWCSSGTDAGHLHVQTEGVSLGQSRHGLWSLEGGPVYIRDELIQRCGQVLFCDTYLHTWADVW